MTVINRESPSLIGGALPMIDGGKPGTNVAGTKFINANAQMNGTDSATPGSGLFINANGDMQKL